MFDWMPIELRAMSVLSAILFTFGGIVGWYMHGRLSTLEKVMMVKSVDIERLTAMCAGTERAVESIKDDNRKMITWIRDDNRATMKRVDEGLLEIRKQLYGSK